MWLTSFSLPESDEHEQEVPEALYGDRTGGGTAKNYIFLVDNQDIAMNIVMFGYQALYLGQQEEEGYYSIDGFVDEMRSMQFQGSCQSSYHYVAACTVKWMNDRILEFCKDAGLDRKSGWQLFKEKEYLGNFENKQELGKILEQFILRFEREPKNDPELSRFHKFDSKGKVIGVRDMEIVDYIVENVSFFVRGEFQKCLLVCAFLEDKLVKKKGKRLKRSDVFRMYEEYCEDNGCQGHVKSGFFKKMEGKGFLVRKYNGDYCYQDIAIWEEDFQPLEAGEKTPFDEHSEQLKLNI